MMPAIIPENNACIEHNLHENLSIKMPSLKKTCLDFQPNILPTERILQKTSLLLFFILKNNIVSERTSRPS